MCNQRTDVDVLEWVINLGTDEGDNGGNERGA